MRGFKVVSIAAVAALGCAMCLLAAPDFSGTWVLDPSKSDEIRRGPGGGRTDAIVTLTIKQSGNGLLISRTAGTGSQSRTFERRFTLDGKEDTNPGAMGRGESVTRSRWQGEELVIEGKQSRSTPQGNLELQTKEVYTLAAGGKVLTITSTRVTPQGEQTTKQVYNKQ